MKYKPPREKERGRRKAESQTQGLRAPGCTPQPSPKRCGSPRGLPGWAPGKGREQACTCRLVNWAHPHLIFIPTPSPSCALSHLPTPCVSLPIPHCSFIFPYIFFFQISPLSSLLLSLRSLSFLLYLLPFTSPFPPTCYPPSPSCSSPHTQRGPEPTREPSAAESPLSAEYVLLLIQCLISQAEVAVAGGREAGTWKMDEEYKNKMARTPGMGSRLSEVLGSRPRAPSFSPTPPPLAGQSSERSPFWVWRAGTMGKIRQMERQGRQRESVGGIRETGIQRKPKQQRALIEADPTQRHLSSVPIRTPKQPYCAPESGPQRGRCWGLDHGYHNPPSFPFRKYHPI